MSPYNLPEATNILVNAVGGIFIHALLRTNQLSVVSYQSSVEDH
jgi:hypothetical protein